MNTKKIINYLIGSYMIIASIAALLLLSQYRFLLFHTLAEFFSIVVSFSIFMIALHAKPYSKNDYLIFIGNAMLFVSFLDLLHTLAYKGMNVFPEFDANLPTQLWISARYLHAATYFCAPLFLRKKLNNYIEFTAIGGITTIILFLIFTRRFPDCFVEGKGLTQFKIVSEYIIIVLFGGAIFSLYRNRSSFDRMILIWIVISFIAAMASEFAFTLYRHVYDIYNFSGHILKIVSFIFLYRAILETGIATPYRLIFYNLQSSITELGSALEIVKKMAITDRLTNAYNRHYFYDFLAASFNVSKGFADETSFILIDLDNFKHINDTFGHLTGDDFLKKTVEILLQALRNDDIVVRWGGDEFLVVLPHTPLKSAISVAERLRVSIEKLEIPTDKGIAHITASLGVTSCTREDRDLDRIIDRVDKAL